MHCHECVVVALRITRIKLPNYGQYLPSNNFPRIPSMSVTGNGAEVPTPVVYDPAGRPPAGESRWP
jgi:hypothetical protein